MHLLYCYYVFLIFISFVVLHIWLKNILRMGSTTAKRAHGRENNLRTLAVYKVSRRNSGFTASSVSGRDHHVYLCIPLFVVQSLSRVQFFATPWTATCQASLSFTISRSLLKLMSIESLMQSNHLILCHPLLLLQFFPASGSFPMSWFFASGGQSIGASASTSVLPINSQDWFPLGLTGLISLQSKGLSRVFSNTTVQKHQFFGAQLSLSEKAMAPQSHTLAWKTPRMEEPGRL